MGENNVGKSNVLEALTIFNDADIKLCSEEDYFKDHEKDTILSLEEKIGLDHEIIGLSCVDLRIRTEEIGEGLKELSKTLISYPFDAFVKNFIDLIASYNSLESFLNFYKEKLELCEFSTKPNKKKDYQKIEDNLNQ